MNEPHPPRSNGDTNADDIPSPAADLSDFSAAAANSSPSKTQTVSSTLPRTTPTSELNHAPISDTSPTPPEQSLFPPSSGHRMQVVDYEEHFNDALETFLSYHGLPAAAFDYHVASILGPQSSGKSTLLNLLFGTTFDTMDARAGRYQVTQGVWLGLDPTARTLVFDLEGTDSRERGEDAIVFERKIALFALALSEVLIVNVWEHDVGRRNAANMDLLKTVLELDMQLFFGANATTTASAPVANGDANAQTPPQQRMHKTRLLFVIRDHVNTPFEELCATLREDVHKIWDDIAKPEAASNIPVSDLFDLDFFSLPHKTLMAAEFSEKGSELRRRFEAGEVFDDAYGTGVAADGFAEYARSVWDTIRENRELDIPTQKEMLAHVRCEQLARDALDSLDVVLAKARTTQEESENAKDNVEGSYEALIDKTALVALVETSAAVVSTYAQAAERYSRRVATEKGNDLRERIVIAVRTLLDSQISAATSNSLRKAGAAVREASWKQWYTLRTETTANCVENFDDDVDYKSFTSLSDDHVLAPLQMLITGGRQKLREGLESLMRDAEGVAREDGKKHVVSSFREHVSGPISSLIDGARDDIWTRIGDTADAAWDAARKIADDVLGMEGLGIGGLDEDNGGRKEIFGGIQDACRSTLLEIVKECIGTPSAVLMRMTRRFDDVFRLDERGVPRTFGPGEDIEGMFVTARDSAEGVVALLSTIRLRGSLASPTNTTRSTVAGEGAGAGKAEGEEVSEEQVQALDKNTADDLRERMRRAAGAAFVEARRVQDASKVAGRIPLWVVGLVLVLGWNEFYAVVRNPLLLMLAMVIVPTAYVAYMMDAGTVLVPAVRAAAAPMVEAAREAARRFVEEGDNANASANANANANAITNLNASASMTAGGGAGVGGGAVGNGTLVGSDSTTTVGVSDGGSIGVMSASSSGLGTEETSVGGGDDE